MMERSHHPEPPWPTRPFPIRQKALRALQKDSEELVAEARLLLALKLYETGKLTTGLERRRCPDHVVQATCPLSQALGEEPIATRQIGLLLVEADEGKAPVLILEQKPPLIGSSVLCPI